MQGKGSDECGEGERRRVEDGAEDRDLLCSRPPVTEAYLREGRRDREKQIAKFKAEGKLPPDFELK